MENKLNYRLYYKIGDDEIPSELQTLLDNVLKDLFEVNKKSFTELLISPLIHTKLSIKFDEKLILEQAVQKNAFNVVQALDRNYPHLLDKNIFYKAVSLQCIEIVKYAMCKGINPNFLIKTQEGEMTPLHKACLNKDYPMIQLLLEFGADYKAKDANNLTVHELVEKNNDSKIINFLKEKAPIFLQKYFITVTYLILHLTKIPQDLYPLIMLSIIDYKSMKKDEKQIQDAVSFMSKNKQYLNKKFLLRNSIKLHEKKEDNNVSTFSFFRAPIFDTELADIIKNYTDDESNINNPITKAFIEGSSLQAQDSSTYLTPFLLACLEGKLGAVKKLYELDPSVLKHRREISSILSKKIATNGFNQVGIIVSANYNALWKKLFSNGSETGMHLAAAKGHMNIIKFLLDKKININIEDASGWTALDSACHSRQYDLMKYLKSQGGIIKYPKHDYDQIMSQNASQKPNCTIS